MRAATVRPSCANSHLGCWEQASGRQSPSDTIRLTTPPTVCSPLTGHSGTCGFFDSNREEYACSAGAAIEL